MDEHSKQSSDLLNRRSFIKGGAGAVVAASYMSTLGFSTSAFATHANAVASAKVYVCPPCGLPCDKLTFDKPGNCPQCGMTLVPADGEGGPPKVADRKSTRLNSSHEWISYAVFCLKKKK